MYSPSYLTADSATRILQNFVQVMVQNGTRIIDLELILPHGLNRIAEWSNNLEFQPQADCINHMVHEMCLSQSDSLAMSARDGILTYYQLDDLSTRLAYSLMQMGTKPESMIAIHFDKSCWALVSTLAILKTGGAVVPLDVQHPMERIQVMLDDAKVKLLLTSHRYKDNFRDTALNVLVVDHDQLQSLLSRPSLLSSAVQPHNSAFVIYTSGSTRKLKGVILDHAALCTAMQAHGKTYGMST
jgi:non-ribosomal peptide synthetase component F